ncbi:MAG: hypothetical protein QM786_08050 [Breznakibacter sp.]
MLSGQGTFTMFREPSYITFAGGIGNIEKLIFEANIVPYYLVSFSNSDRWGVELSPQVILRMYNQESYPVRTPSFMPRVTGFYQFRQADNNQSDWFGYFSWWHHSNGQENSFYQSDSISINTLSGNFATNAIEAGMFFSRLDKRNPYVLNYLKVSSVFHYHHVEELDNRMGDLRFFINLQSSVNVSKTLRMLNLLASNARPGSSMLYLSTNGWISDKFNDYKPMSVKRLIFSETISFKPNFFRDVTLFAQYYYGQDYYNIYFNRRLHVLRFGIMAKPNLTL